MGARCVGGRNVFWIQDAQNPEYGSGHSLEAGVVQHRDHLILGVLQNGRWAVEQAPEHTRLATLPAHSSQGAHPSQKPQR